VIAKSNPKLGWTPTPAAFRGLLAWLDGGADSNGQSYLEMRRRLVAYFQRKRCPSADDLADETLNRVARRLEEEGQIRDATASQYCYIVAKFVFLEHLRLTSRVRASAAEAARPPIGADVDEESRLQCLDRCLLRLTAQERRIILGYYKGSHRTKIEQRRALAVDLAMTTNALAIRACRIRIKLEACVQGCRGPA
jgi:DNA-directed RNA polymerase specialized sigma24 family protein